MATSLARPTANRAVHLRITPRPSNLGESREIMRLISQFGEIEYFKNLKYDTLSAPNAALVIYKDEDAAKECLKRSPIRFRMGRVSAKQQLEQQQRELEERANAEQARSKPSNPEQRSHRGPVGAPFGLSANQSRSLSTSTLPTPPANPIRMPFDPTPAADTAPAEEEPRIFQIQTNTTFRHFRTHINTGHYHGNFAIDSKAPGQEDLSKKVPLVGMSVVDWKAVERPWKVIEWERKRLGGGKSLGRMAREARGEVERREEVEGLRRGFGDVRVGAGASEEVEEEKPVEAAREGIDGDVFKPFGEATAESRTPKEDADDMPLQRAMRGWEDFFPGISSGEEVERYSRKRK